MRLADELGLTTDAAIALAGLAWLQARRGEEQAARASAARAGRLGERHQVHLALVWAASALGDLEAGAGRPEQAEAHYRRLVVLLDRHGIADPDLSPAPELCEVLVATGRRDEARALADEHLLRAQDKASRGRWRAPTVRSAPAGRTGSTTSTSRRRSPCTHAPPTSTRSRGPGWPSEPGCAATDDAPTRARCWSPRWRPSTGSAPALGGAGRCRARGTGRTPRRRDAGAVDLLTPQERQTAQPLAAGRTTREAAAALFLSPKTVEFHLRNVYIKLAIHSREEPARAMADEV